MTAGLSRRYRAASARTADAGPEHGRGSTSVDWRRNRARPGAAAARSRPSDGRRSRGRIRAAARVGAVHDLDELSAFEHKEQVGVVLKKARI